MTLLCLCVKIPLFYEIMVIIYGRGYVTGFVVAVIIFLNKTESWQTKVDFHNIFCVFLFKKLLTVLQMSRIFPGLHNIIENVIPCYPKCLDIQRTQGLCFGIEII